MSPFRLALPLVLALGFAPLGAEAQVHCEATHEALVFDAYDQRGQPTDGVGRVVIRCDNASPEPAEISFDVVLSPGSSGSYAERQLRAGERALRYNLYLDPARSIVWGDGTGGTGVRSESVLVPGLGSTVLEYPVYGRIVQGQRSAVGRYADDIALVLRDGPSVPMPLRPLPADPPLLPGRPGSPVPAGDPGAARIALHRAG